MKKILIVATFNNHYRFFERLSAGLQDCGYEAHLLTNRLSIIRESRFPNHSIFPIKFVQIGTEMEFGLRDSFEVSANLVSIEKAKKIANSVWKQLTENQNKYRYEIILMWSGVRLIEQIVNHFAKKNNISTLFFELGNFPEKLFVDPLGTNANSLLAKDKSVLDQFDFNYSEYLNWKEQYLEKSKNVHQVPQSSSVGSVDYHKNLVDLVGFKFKNFVQYEPLVTKEKLIGKYLRNFITPEYDKIDLSNTDYIFFPMQVNKDAQLILNSEIGNLDAMYKLAKIAKSNNKNLLIKPHPAEVELGFIKKIQKLKNELGFSFVNDNTLLLIEKAAQVYTINSTVGLQAKILGKKVNCFGRAFYDEFTEEELGKYLTRYLIDAEFWDDDPISSEITEKILSRSKLKLS